MTTESIIILVIAAAVAAVVWQLRKKKAEPAPPAQATPPSGTTPVTPPAPTPAAALNTADYADSFFSGWLAGMPIPPYTLPAGATGYGPDGRYDKDRYDPRHFDAVNERIVAADGTYIDVRSLTRYYPDGSTDRLSREQMRQYLYGLSIDPASMVGRGLLSQAMLTAPRSIGRTGPGAGQGAFGG